LSLAAALIGCGSPETRTITGQISTNTYSVSHAVVVAQSSDHRVWVAPVAASGRFTLTLPPNVEYRITLANTTAKAGVYSAVARINWPTTSGAQRWAHIGAGDTLNLGPVFKRGTKAPTGTMGVSCDGCGKGSDGGSADGGGECKEDDGAKTESSGKEDDCDCGNKTDDHDKCDKDDDGDKHDSECDKDDKDKGDHDDGDKGDDEHDDHCGCSTDGGTSGGGGAGGGGGGGAGGGGGGGGPTP
jgi:hypothetical protein